MQIAHEISGQTDYEGKADGSSSGGSVEGTPETNGDGDVKKPFWKKVTSQSTLCKGSGSFYQAG